MPAHLSHVALYSEINQAERLDSEERIQKKTGEGEPICGVKVDRVTFASASRTTRGRAAGSFRRNSNIASDFAFFDVCHASKSEIWILH